MVGFKKKISPIEEMFTRITSKYDLLNHLLSFGLDILWRKRCAREISKNGIILDLCTGTGDLAIEINSIKNSGTRIMGIDFSHEMLKWGLAKCHRKGIENSIRFIQAEVEKLPFNNDQFDYITIAFGLRNILDHHLSFREMFRVVKKGGTVFVLEMSRPKSKIIEKLYYTYLKVIVPYFGGLISRNRGAYKYLAYSIIKFIGPDELSNRMRTAGFSSVSYIPLTFGIAAIHSGVKCD